MKKLLSLFAASAMIVCMVSSCSAADNTKDDNNSKSVEEEKDYTKALVGKWEMPSLVDAGMDSGGLEFEADGTGSIYMDTSSIIHAEGKSICIGSGDEKFAFTEDMVQFDGNTLKIDLENNDILTMEKIEEDDSENAEESAEDGTTEAETADIESFDGEYKFVSGSIYDVIVEGLMKDSTEFKKEDLNVIIGFSGEKSEITYDDIFTYSADKDNITIMGWASFIGNATDGEDLKAKYKIDGTTLEVTSSEGNIETLYKKS